MRSRYGEDIFMLTIVKRIDIGSAFKVGAFTTGLLYAIFGLLFSLIFLPLTLISSNVSTYSSYSGSSSFSGGEGGAAALGALCVFYFCGIFVYAILGGLYFAIVAFIYNLVSGWVGGLKVELEDEVSPMTMKQKRDMSNSVDELFADL
jgi:hypothetical protein